MVPPIPSLSDGVWQQIQAADVLRIRSWVNRASTFAVVERLVRHKGLSAASPLLDTLEVTEEAKVRERLLDLLVSLGDDVRGMIADRLSTVRAALQRDYLITLGKFATLPPEFDADTYLMHPETIVRREAVRLLLKNSDTREATLRRALADPDERTVFLALAVAQDRCSNDAMRIIRGARGSRRAGPIAAGDGDSRRGQHAWPRYTSLAIAPRDWPDQVAAAAAAGAHLARDDRGTECAGDVLAR